MTFRGTTLIAETELASYTSPASSQFCVNTLAVHATSWMKGFPEFPAAIFCDFIQNKVSLWSAGVLSQDECSWKKVRILDREKYDG